MEEVIIKLRRNKKLLRRLLKLIKKEVDIEEEITDVIYMILDYKNS